MMIKVAYMALISSLCVLTACTSTQEPEAGSLNDQWGQDTRILKENQGKRINFSGEVDVMKDTGEKRGW